MEYLTDSQLQNYDVELTNKFFNMEDAQKEFNYLKYKTSWEIKHVVVEII